MRMRIISLTSSWRTTPKKRITSLKGSLDFENLRYAIERWNSENAAHTEVKLKIASTALQHASFEEKSIFEPIIDGFINDERFLNNLCLLLKCFRCIMSIDENTHLFYDKKYDFGNMRSLHNGHVESTVVL
uniref:FBA_2 domain-containing protein n=1 Tax=Heterorhabditis bacteriophora TaxID=37862 RepID=A0A1I7XDK5_HETBA